jgi:hypothetical protein
MERPLRQIEDTLNKHTLTLMGGPQGELRIPASVLLDAVGALVEGARLATRFVIEGESVRKGPRPAWLDAACDFEVTGLTSGSAVIAVEARTLGEVDQARFGPNAQRAAFGEADDRLGAQTAIDIFGQVLGSVVSGSREDVVADRALLETCARFARVAGGRFAGLRLEGIQGRSSPVEIALDDVTHIERLRDETPRPQGARVAGVLDTVSASRADIVLLLKDGSRVPARMEQHDLASLRGLLGAHVVVSGVAHYRPSGRLLRLDVEHIDAARPEDAVFEHPPIPRRQRIALDTGTSSEAGGVSSFFGTWPGDETDEELLAALRAIA